MFSSQDFYAYKVLKNPRTESNKNNNTVYPNKLSALHLAQQPLLHNTDSEANARPAVATGTSFGSLIRTLPHPSADESYNQVYTPQALLLETSRDNRAYNQQ